MPVFCVFENGMLNYRMVIYQRFIWGPKVNPLVSGLCSLQAGVGAQPKTVYIKEASLNNTSVQPRVERFWSPNNSNRVIHGCYRSLKGREGRFWRKTVDCWVSFPGHQTQTHWVGIRSEILTLSVNIWLPGNDTQLFTILEGLNDLPQKSQCWTDTF